MGYAFPLYTTWGGAFFGTRESHGFWIGEAKRHKATCKMTWIHHQILAIFCFSVGLGSNATKPDPSSSWWLNQPKWNICSSNWIISPARDEHTKYLKPPPCHLLWRGCVLKRSPWYNSSRCTTLKVTNVQFLDVENCGLLLSKFRHKNG